MSEREIDSRIVAWLDEHELGYETWNAELENEGFLKLMPGINTRRLWEVYGFEAWMIECVRSIAFTDEPTPFHPYSAGFWMEVPEGDPPMFLAIMTPLTDTDLAARQLKKKHRVEEGHIASYQWKGPFELLEMESSGAFLHSWWAIRDALQTAHRSPHDVRTP
jgi:hypothetical protein